MSDATLTSLIASFESIANVRNLDQYNPVVLRIENPLLGTFTTVACSKSEPSFLILPINGKWLNLDPAASDYRTIKKLVDVIPGADLVDRGAYDATVLYNLNDKVESAGFSFYSLVPHNRGNPLSDTKSWAYIDPLNTQVMHGAWTPVDTYSEFLTGYEYYNGNVATQTVGPQGLKGDKGDKGDPGLSAFQVAQSEGYTSTQAAWLLSLHGTPGAAGPIGLTGASGTQGKSAYQIALDNGFVGTEAQWLDSLSANGKTGPAGKDGKSAYEVAVASGYTGTITQWLASLVGPQGPAGTGGTGGTVSVAVGSVTTGPSGSNATVTNAGTATNVVLNFTIPRGADGSAGTGGGDAFFNLGTVVGTLNVASQSNCFVVATIGGPTTVVLANPPANTPTLVTLELTNPGTNLTWPTSVKPSGGAFPSFTLSGVDVVTLFTHNGGVTWRLAMSIKDSK